MAGSVFDSDELRESTDQLIEEEIAEFGEHYLLQNLTARKEAIEASLGENRVNRWDATTRQPIAGASGVATSFDSLTVSPNRFPVPRRVSTGEAETYRSIDARTVERNVRIQSLNASMFFGLDVNQYQVPLLAYGTYEQNIDPVLRDPNRPPIPSAEGVDLRGLYDAAYRRIKDPSEIRRQAEEQFKTLLAELGASVQLDDASGTVETSGATSRYTGVDRRRSIGELVSSFNEEGFWTSESVFSGADADQQDLIRFAYTNYLFYYYLWHKSGSNLRSGGSPATDSLVSDAEFENIAQLFVDYRIRKYLVDAIRNRILQVTSVTRDGDANLPDSLSFEEAERVRARLERGRGQSQAEVRQAIRDQAGEGAPPPEQARLRRFAEQCFLLDYLRDYAIINQTRNPTYVHEQTGNPDFHMLHGRPETLINKLVYNPQLESMDNLRPSEYSGLVPLIRLYKVFSEFNPDGTPGATYEQEIPFSGSISDSEINSIIHSSFDRGQGVGLKSFDWRLEGQNPYTARRDIFGELKLFFQSLDELVKERSAPAVFGDGRFESAKKFRYIDLVNIGLTPQASESNLGFIWNPDYYQIKIEVGWAPPDDSPGTDTFRDPNMAAAIEQSRMTMFLSAVDHTIDINDQGNVNLSIEYIAYQEASYQDADSDILSDRQTRDRRLRNLKSIQTARAEGCSSDQLAELRQEYTDIVREENFRNYNRILSSLFEKERIFFTKVNTNVLDSYINDGRTQFSQPLFDRLFGASEPVNVRANTPIGEVAPPSSAPATLDGSEVPQDRDQLSARLQDLSYDVNDFEHALQFFYFGDLLQIVLEEINSSTVGTDEQLPSESKVEKDLQILLGPINYLETVGPPGDTRSRLFYDINLADIPISVNYYIDWFLGAVIAQERTIYPLLNFIRDIANNLLSNMMRSQCHGLNNVERENLQLRTNFFSATGADPLNGSKNILPDRDATAGQFRQGSATTPGSLGIGGAFDAPLPPIEGTETRIDVDILFQDRDGPLPLQPPRGSQRATKYMLLYGFSPGTTENLVGNRDADRLRGIYHLGIGRDRGILNSINFNKTDIAGLREARFENSFINQLTGLAILSNVYDIQVKCAGNTMFYPGMKIYLDPRGLSPEIGNPATEGTVSNVLGIGGYHTIYKVRSYVESGKFETTIDAVFESAARSLYPATFPTTDEERETQSDCDQSIGESIIER